MMETHGIVPISRNVVMMMQNRLEEAESAATQLTTEIYSAREANSTDRFSLLLSKVQSMETVLQSLKLNFVNLSTLTRQPSDMEQKLVEMTDIYTDEIKKLSNEIAHLQKDKQEMKERQIHLELDLQRFKVALEETLGQQSKTDDTLNAEKQRSEKLTQKLTEYDRALTEEKRLRLAVDRSNGELGVRLDEMELLLKQEQTETQKFTEDFLSMKKEVVRKTEVVLYGKEKQRQLQSELVAMGDALENSQAEVERIKDENCVITNEMSTVHQQYSQLNGQLEAMQKLFNDFQAERKNIESDCAKLQQKVIDLTGENSQLTAEVVRVKNHDESAKLIQTRQELRKMCKEHDRLLNENDNLSSQVESLEETVRSMEEEFNECQLKSNEEAKFSIATIGGLEERLGALKTELEGLEGEKTNLMSEVHGTVDAMESEKETLQKEVQSYQQQLTIALDELEEEKISSGKLQQKLDALTREKPEFTHFDRRLAELTEQKNSLSYENGQLQSKVQQQQELVQEAQADQTELNKLSRKHTTTENKLRKMKCELETCQQSLKHTELLNQQLQTSSDVREADLTAAVKVKEQAVADAKQLAQRVESLEEALQNQEEMRGEIEQSLREDNSKVAESLEGMMALHTELQCKYENLHIDLGKKDAELTEIKKEKKRFHVKITAAENELKKTKETLADLETKQSSKHKNIETELKNVKRDNSKLVKTLQDTLEMNEELRGQVAVLEQTVTKLRTDSEKHKKSRMEMENKLKQAESSHSAKVSELETQVRKEREKAYERMEGQLKTVQKETEGILEKNSELTKANCELKNLLDECDTERRELECRIDSLQEKLGKTQESLKYKTRQSAKAKEMSKEMNKLESDNQELEEKCQTQQDTINRFVSQFQEVQSEMKQLVSLHSEQADQMSDKEQLLQTEQMRCEELRQKYHQAKKQITTLQALQKHTETQLVEAHNDTMIAATTLEDTNRYFKERFSALSSELSCAKKRQVDLEWKNMEKQHQLIAEKHKMEDTTKKAKDMIRASRHALTRLADETEFANTTNNTDQSSLAQSTTFSPRRLHSMSHADASLDSVLASSALDARPNSPGKTERDAASPFTSSSQKLDAIISDMERRRLIT